MSNTVRKFVGVAVSACAATIMTSVVVAGPANADPTSVCAQASEDYGAFRSCIANSDRESHKGEQKSKPNQGEAENQWKKEHGFPLAPVLQT